MPESAAFTEWLAGLDIRDTGGLDGCSVFDRPALAALCEATGGSNWASQGVLG